MSWRNILTANGYKAMPEVLLRIVEVSPMPNGIWEAELWSNYPGHANHQLLAGGNLNNLPARFTQAQLEAPAAGPGGVPIDLSWQAVSDMVAGVTPAAPGMVDAVGLRLSEMLHLAGVAPAWMQLRASAAGVRTYLSVSGGLARWPWEMLAHRSNRQVDPLFLEHRNPIVRVHHTFPVAMSWNDEPVRVLLVSGQHELDTHSRPPARAVDEFRKIRGALHRSGASALVHLCEAPGDVAQLTRCLEEFSPHVVHFIGHGIAVQGAVRDFALLFNPAAAPWQWSASQMYQYFRQQRWKPRLVVLNACHGSGMDDQAASVAESLLDAGVGAVVAAPAELSIQDAKRFAAEYYDKFAALRPLSSTGIAIDVAVVQARESIWQNARAQRNWALPVLSVIAPVDQIVRFQRANTHVMRCDVVGEVFVRPGRFVNRAADRWKIISSFRPASDVDPVYPGLILMGNKGLGKSWLIKRAARELLDSGFVLSHAVLNGKKTDASSLEVLIDWHGDAASTSYVRRSIAGSHFNDFESELAQARVAPPADGFRAAFAAFKKGLQVFRQGRPVVLILDQISRDGVSLEATPQDFRQGLLTQLLAAVNAGDADVAGIFPLLIVPVRPGAPVLPFDADAGATEVDPQTVQRLITNNRIPEYVTYGISDLDRFRVLHVPGLPNQDAQNLFDEFSDFQTNDYIEALRAVFVHMGQSSWRNGETDGFATLESWLAPAMQQGTTPL